MKRQTIIWTLALSLITATAALAGEQKWAIQADYAESCSCNPACPCVLGSAPTFDHCEGIGFAEIKEGHYGDVRLDGISVVTTFRMGEWIKYYVSEDATNEQVKAAQQLIATAFEVPADWKVLSTEKVPVSVERTTNTIQFSVPASKVEIEMMKGLDGKSIQIQNLPADVLRDYTQYKSIAISHQSKEQEFSYSGTNGFTSKVDIASKE